MNATVIAALITGGCAIIAAVIAGGVAIYQFKKKRKEEKKIVELHVRTEPSPEIPIPPPPEHPVFLNPDEYDIDEEEYFVTLAGLLQQSRSPNEVTLTNIKKTYEGDRNE